MAIAALMKDGAYEHAVKAVDAYRPLAENARDRDLRAEVLAAWATSLQKSGGDFKPRALAAAEEYKAISAAQPLPAAKADRLRRAASLYKLGGNAGAAVTTLQEATKLAVARCDDRPGVGGTGRCAPGRGPARGGCAQGVQRGDGRGRARSPRRRATGSRGNSPMAATRAWRRSPANSSAKSPSRKWSPRPSRSSTNGRWSNWLTTTSAQPTSRKPRSGCASSSASYPSGAEAPLARLLLGVCLIQRSSATLPSPPDAATAAKLRDEALKYFKQIVAETDDVLKRTGKLGDRDAWLRREAGLRVLQTYLQMKKPNDLLVEADKLRDRHRNSVEELIILSLIYHAFKQKGGRGPRTADPRPDEGTLRSPSRRRRSPPIRASTAGRTGRRSGSRRRSRHTSRK